MDVISCSRRTDIPRRYPEWLESCLLDEEAAFVSPRGGFRTISLAPGEVHSIVMWSKDYGPLLRRPRLVERLMELNPFFHFTVTGLGGSAWEPDVCGWQAAVKIMAELAGRFGPERINWRFDPIVFWEEQGSAVSNMRIFPDIGEAVAALGVETCTFSFTHWYAKSVRRAARSGMSFLDPEGEKPRLAGELSATTAALGIRLASCSNEALETVPGVTKARCIDADHLTALRRDGLRASSARDSGQRIGCGCAKSIDIGSYSQRCGVQPCVYCYAN